MRTSIWYALTIIDGEYHTEEIEIEVIPGHEPYNSVEAKVKGEMNGLFGRKDFCDIWKDFRNGKITREEKNKLFDKIKR